MDNSEVKSLNNMVSNCIIFNIYMLYVIPSVQNIFTKNEYIQIITFNNNNCSSEYCSENNSNISYHKIGQNKVNIIMNQTIPIIEFFNNNINKSNYIKISEKNEYHAKIRKICLYGLNRTNIDNHIDGIDETHSKKIFINSLESIKKRSTKNKFAKTIHLGEYKEKLKEENDIPGNNTLYILKKDFHIDFNLIDEELYIVNHKSEIYNNFYFNFMNKNKTDKNKITRKEEFSEYNITLCEKDCELKDCSCINENIFSLISEIKFDIEKLFPDFKNLYNIADVELLQCFCLFLSKKIIFKISDNYLITVLPILSFISIFSLIFHNKSIIQKYIMEFSETKIINNKRTQNNKYKDFINNMDKKFKFKNKTIYSDNLKNIFVFKLFLLIELIKIITSYNKYFILKINSFEIILKVKGPGTNKVYERIIPNKVIINGNEQSSLNKYYFMNQSDNNVELIWNSDINNSQYMFDGCINITEIKFSNFDTSKITFMERMFQNCNSLTSLDLSNFDTSSVTDLSGMFYGCSSLTSLNLSNFDVSKVTDMHQLFYGCSSLTSLNLSNFYTPKVRNNHELFKNCKNLEYINIEHFSEESLYSGNYYDIFYNIPNNVLVCINSNAHKMLSQLNDINCISFDCSDEWIEKQKKLIDGQCYNNCSDHPSLKKEFNGECYSTCPYGEYQDEANFSITKCKCQLEKCDSCPLEALKMNLCSKCHTGFYPMENDISNVGKYFDCFNEINGYYLDENDSIFKKCYERCTKCEIKGNNTNHNCLECNSNFPKELLIGQNVYYNCYPECNGLFYFDNIGEFNCINESECPENFNKLITENGQCTNDCKKISNYQYEFRKICYNKCPSNTYTLNDNPYFCEIKCIKQNPFEIVDEQNCTDFCSINDMENKLCKSKYEDEDTNAILILNNIHKDIISTNFNKSILFKENKKILIEEIKTTFTITTNSIQKKEANPKINLGECENVLKSKYNLQNTDNLIIFIINTKKNMNDNDKTVFEIYAELNGNNFLTKLDLNLCDNIIKNNEISKCSNYSIESLLDDLCISCYDSYYTIHNNNLNTNSYIKCYKNLKGYYLDKNDNSYKKCHLTCETCLQNGNFSNHNCISCGTNYTYELNLLNSLNCYNICPFYSYHDSNVNKNFCTPDFFCPISHNKLIKEKKLCVEDCSKDSIYK